MRTPPSLSQTTSRRKVLQGALAFGGAAAAGPLLTRMARAMEHDSDRYFIFCNFGGGWDVTLSLDPRDPAVYTDERMRETWTQCSYAKLKDARSSFNRYPSPIPGNESQFIGPYLREGLGEWIQHAAIVRGIQMASVGHIGAGRQFITGRPPTGDAANGSSIATYLAHEFGADQPIPNLTARVESFNRNLPPWASGVAVRSPSDLVRILSPGEASLSAVEDEHIEMFLDQESQCSSICRSDLRHAASQALNDAKALVRGGSDRLFRFDRDDMSYMRDFYGFTASGGYLTGDSGASAALASQAITSKLARVVSIRCSGGDLDTHDDATQHNDQGPNQEAGFRAIRRLLEDFSSRSYTDPAAFPYGGSDSWLNHVTIIAHSEFGRSALYGGRGGRDHHFMNACLLAGADIIGGKVVGQSAAIGMNPQGCDLVTGEPDPTVDAPQPKHIFRDLLLSAGIPTDVADLRVDPLRACFRSLTTSA